MKRQLLAFSLLSVTLGAASAGLLQDEYTLRLNFEPGQVDRYQAEMVSTMKMSSPGAGDQDFSVKGTMDYAYHFGKVGDDGKAELEMKVTNIQVEASGAAEAMMSGQEMPKEYSIVGKIDDRYRLTDAKTVGLPAQTQMIMSLGGSGTSSVLFELPEKPVKVGDTWPVRMPANPMVGDKPQELTAKFVGIKEVEGTPFYEIQVAGNVPLDIDMAEVMKKMSEAAGGAAGGGGGMADLLAGMSIRIKGALDVTNTAHFEVKTGRLSTMDTKVDAKQTMSMAELGVSIDIAGTTRVKMKLAKE